MFGEWYGAWHSGERQKHSSIHSFHTLYSVILLPQHASWACHVFNLFLFLLCNFIVWSFFVFGIELARAQERQLQQEQLFIASLKSWTQLKLKPRGWRHAAELQTANSENQLTRFRNFHVGRCIAGFVYVNVNVSLCLSFMFMWHVAMWHQMRLYAACDPVIAIATFISAATCILILHLILTSCICIYVMAGGATCNMQMQHQHDSTYTHIWTCMKQKQKQKTKIKLKINSSWQCPHTS
jgi:hypothetical protein